MKKTKLESGAKAVLPDGCPQLSDKNPHQLQRLPSKLFREGGKLVREEAAIELEYCSLTGVVCQIHYFAPETAEHHVYIETTVHYGEVVYTSRLGGMLNELLAVLKNDDHRYILGVVADMELEPFFAVGKYLEVLGVTVGAELPTCWVREAKQLTKSE